MSGGVERELVTVASAGVFKKKPLREGTFARWRSSSVWDTPAERRIARSMYGSRTPTSGTITMLPARAKSARPLPRCRTLNPARMSALTHASPVTDLSESAFSSTSRLEANVVPRRDLERRPTWTYSFHGLSMAAPPQTMRTLRGRTASPLADTRRVATSQSSRMTSTKVDRARGGSAGTAAHVGLRTTHVERVRAALSSVAAR